MMVDCLTNPIALPAPKKQQAMEKFKTITLCKVYKYPCEIIIIIIIRKIPFYPLIQWQEAIGKDTWNKLIT